jgi:hypothetical protein
LYQLVVTTALGVTQAVPVEVKAVDFTELRQHDQIRTGAAAAIENPQWLDAAGVDEKWTYETTETSKPEMVLLHPTRGLDQGVHGS